MMTTVYSTIRGQTASSRVVGMGLGRRRLTEASLAAVAVAGAWALFTLEPLDYPLPPRPSVVVSVSYPGASWDRVEREVVDPIEHRIAAEVHSQRIEANAQDGQATIVSYFSAGTKAGDATLRVRRAVDGVAEALPSEIRDLRVSPFDPSSDPALVLAVTAPASTLPAGPVRFAVLEALRQVPGVAQVVASGGDTTGSAARVNGEPAVIYEIRNASDHGPAKLAAEVRSRLAGLATLLPAGARIEIIRDRGANAGRQARWAGLATTIGIGLGLLLTRLLLGSASFVMLAGAVTPLAVAIVVMAGLGWTVDAATLLGLGLAVGVILDDRIALGENLVRNRELGADARGAARLSVAELRGPFAAAVAAATIVLGSVGLVGGPAGHWLLRFAVPAAVASLTSWIFALAIEPLSAGRKGPSSTPTGKRTARIQAGLDRIADWYDELVARIVDHRTVAAGLAVGFVALGLAGQAARTRASFLPVGRQREVAVEMTTSPGADLGLTDRWAREVDRTARRTVASSYTITEVSGAASRVQAYLTLAPGAKRARVEDLSRQIESKLEQIDGVTYSIRPLGGRTKSIRLDLRGRDASTLAGVSRRIATELRGIPGTTDVTLTSRTGSIDHLDGERWVGIQAKVEGQSIGAVTRQIEGRLNTVPLPPGYQLVMAGPASEQAALLERLLIALAVAVGVVGLVLARHFKSLSDPLAILIALPIAAGGSLLAAGGAITLPTVASELLVGILVIRQATILLTCARRRRARGATLRVSLVEAGRVRIRPVVVTTAAIAVAMLPVVVTGHETLAPFGLATIGGIAAAAVTVLLAIPALSLVLAETGERIRAWI